MGYIIISIFTLIFSFFLFKKVSGTMSIKQLNLISFNFYYKIIIQSFIGVNIVILGLDNHYLLNRITDYSIKEAAYYSVLLVLIVLPLSMLFISFVFRFDAKKEWINYTNKEITNLISSQDKAIFVTVIIFTILSFLSIAYTFLSIGTIPIFHLFSGATGTETAKIRIIASREFDGIVYVRNIFGITMTPLLSYIAYSYTYKSSYKAWKVIFWFLFSLSILILTYNLAKGPVLMYVISFIFIHVLIKGKVNLRKTLSLMGIVSTFLIMYYILIADYDMSFFNVNSGPLGRILLGQIAGLYFHFQYFPDIFPFLQGQSFPGFILRLFDIENVRTSRIIMELVNPSGVDEGTAGVMNTLFIAEIYANFGWLGIFFGTIYVGFYIQVLYIIFIRISKNPITISLFTYFTYKLPISGGFFDFIYNPGLITVLFLMLLFYLIASFIHKRFIYERLSDVRPLKKGEMGVG